MGNNAPQQNENEHNNAAVLDLFPKLAPAQFPDVKKLCYRHRPDLLKKDTPDSCSVQDIQRQMERLTTSDRAAIAHIWSTFSAAPADQRLLILKGLLTSCCMPQLSFLYSEIKPLLRIDFVSVLPREITLKVFSYLDAKSLCHAAQVSKTWQELADNDAVWHRMCEQHIDKKCTKCGWGLPLLHRKPTGTVRKYPSEETMSLLREVCNPLAPETEEPAMKRLRAKTSTSTVAVDGDNISYETPPDMTNRRPWKYVYSERLVVERNWRNNKYKVRVLNGHTDGVMCAQFCDTANILMTGSYDKTIRIWNLQTGTEIRRLTGHTRCVRALQFDETKLISGAMDNTLKIWNWHTGQCIRTLEGHTGGVLALHFGSRLMASGSTDHTIRIWNFQLGECCTLTGHTEWVNSVQIFQEESQLISASDDSTVRMWDLCTRTCIRVFCGHVGQVQIALLSPKGFTHRLMEEAMAMTTRLKSLDSSVLDRVPENDLAAATFVKGSNACSSLSDSPIIISGSLDNTIKQWDMATGVCLRTLFGHAEGVWSLAFDKLRLVSGSHDSTVRIWDMESGRCMHALDGHHGPVTSVTLSDTKIITTSDDGTVMIWDYGIQ
ncbi:hypothetical protein DFQ28_009917 [Apophysomyces sp. BC1034]|nr:hypothetical protein DFQ30_009526 [Apophysomyces sp. BC1015]KAG0172293.1 hypothetical protein DFQ29_008433 [Apophysomyces sp. BC1021]KAG0185118.1 hypothetical protein DFQ28_009917 [Apophysomyces sp. BC1034]